MLVLCKQYHRQVHMLATNTADTSLSHLGQTFKNIILPSFCPLVHVAFADLLQHIEAGLPQEWHQRLAESKAGAVEPRSPGSKHRPCPIPHGLKIINATGDTEN